MSAQNEDQDTDLPDDSDPDQEHVSVQQIENVICVSTANGTTVNGVDGLHQAPTIVHHQEEVHLTHHSHHGQCIHAHHCLTAQNSAGPTCNGGGPGAVVTSSGGATLVSVVDHQGNEVEGAHTLVDGAVPVSIPVHQPVVSLPVNVNVPVLQDPNLSCTDGQGHHHHGQHGANVTTASIITIPVVPYTVIGDADGNGATGTISVSIAQPEQIAHHQHQLQQLQQQQLHEEHHHQQQTIKVEQQQHSIPQLTWEEAVSAPVLPVRCKDTNAELHKIKFGSGNKGKCIKAGNDWFTPTEFEALCGRGNSKDWKRSIRFGGRTLQTLIDKGFLVPHASSCICSNCVDDAAATGPIRPFTPYQRKRKNQSSEPSKVKLERLTSKDSTNDESSETPGTPLSVSQMNPLAYLKMPQAATTEDLWKNLEEVISPITNSPTNSSDDDNASTDFRQMVDKLVTAAGMMKTMLQDLKERTAQEAETLRSQLQEQQELQNLQNLQNQHQQHQQQQQQQQQAQQHQLAVGGIARNIIDNPQILRIFDSNRIQTYSIEVLDPETFKQLQAAQTTTKIIYQDRRPGDLGQVEIKQEPGTSPLTLEKILP